MVEESALNSILLLDKCIAKTAATINELEDVEYRNVINSNITNRVNVLLNQIYRDRAEKNYRSAIRKCIFLKKYVEKEMRSSDESR